MGNASVPGPVRRAIILLVALLSVSMNCAGASTAYQAILLHPPLDLHLPGSPSSSIANAVAGGVQGGVFRQGGGFASGEHVKYAMIWRGTADSYINITPVGYAEAEVYDVSLDQQVGMADWHAILWNGAADDFVDLHPIGFEVSQAVGIDGGKQVGRGQNLSTSHALLWSGTAESVVDLHPSGYTDSYAAAVFEDVQVGSVTYHPSGQASQQRAALWRGTAESFVDLHPNGLTGSFAEAVWGDQQVGRGRIGFDTHAMLWHGTAESVVDLNPNGFETSIAYDVYDGQQVGFGSGPATGNQNHAILWNSNAEDFIDIHPFLSGLPQSFDASTATGISPSGEISGFAYSNGYPFAVVWMPVPEPAMWVYLVGAIGTVVCIRRR